MWILLVTTLIAAGQSLPFATAEACAEAFKHTKYGAKVTFAHCREIDGDGDVDLLDPDPLCWTGQEPYNEDGRRIPPGSHSCHLYPQPQP